jgi:glycosyltransferase involved in cell wall biosynthesis
MKILHWLKKENSGLFRTTVELAKYEEKLGHVVALRAPAENETFYGFRDDDFDVHAIHSQINPHYYKDGKPKLLFLHGEPDYGMLTKVSTQAIMDLIPIADAFISFHPDEARIWRSFKRTYTVTKGIDLERYVPIDNPEKKFKGSPSILYCEHWRTFRHPLHSFIALEEVKKKLPSMRFYPFGCPEPEKEFWLRIVKNNRYNSFTPGVFRWQKDIATLISLADIVVSPVFPSYGRVRLEALAMNKPVVAYKTNPHADYKCEPYNPDDMAEKIIACWEEKPSGQRKYAEENLSAMQMAKDVVSIYRRFI